MSLDFYLESDAQPHVCSECGHNGMKSTELFWRNITHNLGKMAEKADIYQVLWRPNENGQVRSKDIVPTLKAGLSDLMNRREYYEQFNAPNGWGTYEHFVPFVKEVLRGCEEDPEALVKVSV